MDGSAGRILGRTAEEVDREERAGRWADLEDGAMREALAEAAPLRLTDEDAASLEAEAALDAGMEAREAGAPGGGGGGDDPEWAALRGLVARASAAGELHRLVEACEAGWSRARRPDPWAAALALLEGLPPPLLAIFLAELAERLGGRAGREARACAAAVRDAARRAGALPVPPPPPPPPAGDPFIGRLLRARSEARGAGG